MTNKISKKDVENVLLKTIHPEINFSLMRLGMIKDIDVKDSKVSLVLLLPFKEIPIKDMLIDLIKESIKKLDKNMDIKVKIAEMNESEKAKFMELAREGWMV